MWDPALMGQIVIHRYITKAVPVDRGTLPNAFGSSLGHAVFNSNGRAQTGLAPLINQTVKTNSE